MKYDKKEIENTIKTFTLDELTEMSKHISTFVDNSKLAGLDIFKEGTLEKAEIFSLCYRAIEYARRFITSESAKSKIDKLIIHGTKQHKKIDALLREYSITSFTHISMIKITEYVKNNMSQINLIIDLYALLSRKTTIASMAKSIGIKVEPTSKKIIKEVYKEEVPTEISKKEESKILTEPDEELTGEEDEESLRAAKAPEEPQTETTTKV